LVGLAVPIRGHDGRRGAIRDLSSLARSGSGVATDCVALAAGHSNSSRKRGVTQRYIGPQKSSNWDKRVAAIEIVEQDAVAEAFDLQINAALVKRVRLSMEEITTVARKIKESKKFDWLNGASRTSISSPN
jgi:hypothetical protein